MCAAKEMFSFPAAMIGTWAQAAGASRNTTIRITDRAEETFTSLPSSFQSI